MFAYNPEKKLSNTLNPNNLHPFSNDEIYCSHFSPTAKDLKIINAFIEDIKQTFPLEKSLSLYISYKGGNYLGDVRVYLGQEPTFANCSHTKLKTLLESLKSYLIVNSVYEMDKGFRYFN